ncbi:helix-turn-helix domain-containing protein [Agromyces binzhouensis]|uniref:helix-turn-helix domain-containing protein n=1 Tax=Agromyces binzhouensis TaxID=1817495 RepID=UPI0036354ABC
MSVRLYNRITANRDLTLPDGRVVALRHPEKSVLLALAMFYNDREGYAWPTVRAIADVCSCSEDTVERSTRTLELHGVIVRVAEYNPDTGARVGTWYFFPWYGPKPPARTVTRPHAFDVHGKRETEADWATR